MSSAAVSRIHPLPTWPQEHCWEGLFESCSDSNQQCVAGCVAQLIVDGFKAVEIGVMGSQTADVLQSAVAGASEKSSGILATRIGIVAFLVTASGVAGSQFFEAANDLSTEGGRATIIGGVNLQYEGTFYFPHQHIWIAGGATVKARTSGYAMVADQLWFQHSTRTEIELVEDGDKEPVGRFRIGARLIE